MNQILFFYKIVSLGFVTFQVNGPGVQIVIKKIQQPEEKRSWQSLTSHPVG